MMERIAEASPRQTARIAGVFYLLTILARVLADAFVRNRLVVSDDGAATATNIMAHEPLFRLGFAVARVGNSRSEPAASSVRFRKAHYNAVFSKNILCDGGPGEKGPLPVVVTS